MSIQNSIPAAAATKKKTNCELLAKHGAAIDKQGDGADPKSGVGGGGVNGRRQRMSSSISSRWSDVRAFS